MKVFQGTKRLLMTTAVALTGYHATAQAPVVQQVLGPQQEASAPQQRPFTDVSLPAYRSAAITTTFKRIKKDHFSLRPLDNSYSSAVWSNFLRALDPGNDIFLQEDITKLDAYKTQIDDEINAGSSAFFDAAYAIYATRIQEASAICMRLLEQPLDFHEKETLDVQWKKDWPYPANGPEREARWRKFLKYATLRNYMEADTASAAQGVRTLNTALEIKTQDKVRKWYTQYFRQATGAAARKEKFAQFLNVAVMEADPHTAYTAPDDRSFAEATTKRYFGLGMELGTQESDFFVKALMPGGTAYKSGKVKENDHVLRISDSNGEMVAVAGMEAAHVAGMIRGDKGTMVSLELQQPGAAPRTVTLQRDEILDRENRARSALITRNGKRYGYIYLPSFYIDPNPANHGKNGCAFNMLTEIEKLKENEVDGIIVDLRNNPGGSLEEAVRMCAGFVPASPISWLRAKDSARRYTSPDMPPLYDGPLTVMVNESSASASEIFAAAMQDLHRAIIVGSPTFGKGSAQLSFNLGKAGRQGKDIPDTSYGILRLTTQKFYRITGLSTQFKGVTPDIILQSGRSLDAVKETDFTSALSYDSMGVPSYQPVPALCNYQEVIRKARVRVGNNPVFADVDKNLSQLKTLREQIAPLDFEGFRKAFQAEQACGNNIQHDRELPAGNALDMQPAAFRSVNPATQQTTAGETLHYNEWLDKLSKDAYLSETVSVMDDMVTGQH